MTELKVCVGRYVEISASDDGHNYYKKRVFRGGSFESWVYAIDKEKDLFLVYDDGRELEPGSKEWQKQRGFKWVSYTMKASLEDGLYINICIPMYDAGTLSDAIKRARDTGHIRNHEGKGLLRK